MNIMIPLHLNRQYTFHNQFVPMKNFQYVTHLTFPSVIHHSSHFPGIPFKDHFNSPFDDLTISVRYPR